MKYYTYYKNYKVIISTNLFMVEFDIVYNDEYTESEDEIEIVQYEDYRDASLIITNLCHNLKVKEIIEIHKNFSKWKGRNGSTKSTINLIINTLKERNIYLNKGNYKYIFDDKIIEKYMKLDDTDLNLKLSDLILKYINGWVFVLVCQFNKKNPETKETLWLDDCEHIINGLYCIVIKLLLTNYKNIISNKENNPNTEKFKYVNPAIDLYRQINTYIIISFKSILKYEYPKRFNIEKYKCIIKDIVFDNRHLVRKKLFSAFFTDK